MLYLRKFVLTTALISGIASYIANTHSVTCLEIQTGVVISELNIIYVFR